MHGVHIGILTHHTLHLLILHDSMRLRKEAIGHLQGCRWSVPHTFLRTPETGKRERKQETFDPIQGPQSASRTRTRDLNLAFVLQRLAKAHCLFASARDHPLLCSSSSFSLSRLSIAQCSVCCKKQARQVSVIPYVVQLMKMRKSSFTSSEPTR